MKIILLISTVYAGMVFGDVSHIVEEYDVSTSTTESPPHKPYVFSYTAGRYTGHVDRQHSEVSDGSGVVRGAFSYVDPRHQVRTVEYVADKTGFYPQLSHEQQPPKESEAVRKATEKHYQLYNKIALEHSQPQVLSIPRDTASVANAKAKHYSLFEKIAQEHAQIAAEREAERLAFEATSEINLIEENHYQEQY